MRMITTPVHCIGNKAVLVAAIVAVAVVSFIQPASAGPRPDNGTETRVAAGICQPVGGSKTASVYGCQNIAVAG